MLIVEEVILTVLVVLLVLLLFLLVLSPFAVGGIYARKMRKKYPFLDMVGLDQCPLCGKKIIRRKFTNNLFLLPYAFKTLRHYEKMHKDISGYARRARLGVTVSVHTFIGAVVFAFILQGIEADYAVNPSASLTPPVSYFLIRFVVLEVIAWTVMAYLLLRKKGDMFGKEQEQRQVEAA